MIEREGRGVLLYLAQEGRGIGLLNKLRAYKLQEQGLDTVDANLELGLPADLRDYGIGAQILVDLGLELDPHPDQQPEEDHRARGLRPVGHRRRCRSSTRPTRTTSAYLRAKRDRMGHTLHHQGLRARRGDGARGARARPRRARGASGRRSVTERALRDRASGASTRISPSGWSPAPSARSTEAGGDGRGLRRARAPSSCRWRRSTCAETGRYAGVACLGAVIRGETDHYDYVCAEAARGIQDVQLRTGVPCAFGVLTVENMEQALARSGGGKRDTGRPRGRGRAADGRAAGGAGVKYDAIGRSYSRTRATDPRIAAAIWEALGDARTVVNVGAGTGNYEPPDREVTAVEPSAVMIAQRPAGRRAGRAGDAPRSCRSRTTASTPRWPCSRSTTGATGARASRRCGASRGARRRVLVGPELRAPAVAHRRVLPVRRATRRPRSRSSPTRPARSAPPRDRRPDPARLPGRLLRRLLAPPARLPRPRGPRRHLGAGHPHARGARAGARAARARTSRPAPGPSATPTCSSATSSTSATASSSPDAPGARPRAAAAPATSAPSGREVSSV